MRANVITQLLRVHWLVVGLLVWMFLACCFPLYDTDLFWHLKTGELILQNGVIPGFDTYTYADYGRRWIDLHWGFQVVVAILYRIGGANLLILTKAAILTAALGVGYAAGGRGLSVWLRVLCWLLPAITISGRGYERPEVTTVLCLAIWLWIIPRLEQRPRLIWLLPLLQVFWINFHALYILGLVVGGCFAVDFVVRSIAAGRWGLAPVPETLIAQTVVRAGMLCALAALVNPYLEEGALFPFELLRKFTVEQDFYSVRIGEFQKPVAFFMKFGFANIYLDAEILLWVATAVSFIRLALRRRYSVFRTLLFAGFSYLAWKATRNTNIFSMVSAFVLVENLAEARLAAKLPVATQPATAKAMSKPVIAVATLILCMIAAVVSGEWNRRAERIRPFRLGETQAWYPHAAAKFMRQPSFPDTVFASHFGVASVYTYYNAPRGRVFMDGRLEVCSRETFRRYTEVSIRMAKGDPGWVELLRDDSGGLPAIMLDTRTSPLMIVGVAQTPGWRLVFADSSVAVFFEEAVAERLQLPAADPELLKPPPKLDDRRTP